MTAELSRLLTELYDAELAAVRERTETDLDRPIRTEWTVRELLWADTEAVLKGTGRVRLDDRDRTALGERAGDLPLLG